MMMNQDEIVVAGLPLQFPKPTAGSQLPTLAEWNQRYIEYVLSFTKGKKTAAARILGINRRTLYRRKKTRGNGDIESIPNGLLESSEFASEFDSEFASGLASTPVAHQVQ